VQSEPYVALSAQVTLERRLNSLAINVANMNTVGFRESGVSFHTFVAQNGAQPVAYASPGQDYISRTQGPLIKTDNPLDIAITGDSWFSIQTPAGTAYTRDGRMRMQPNGSLQTLNGYPILDAGGAPLQLDPAAGPPVIGSDGMIHQNGRQIGAVGLFLIPDDAHFQRFDNSAVLPDKPATPVLSFERNGVVQGQVEGSDVNPVLEMAKLMTISRAFDDMSSAAQSTDNTFSNAIKSLGDMTS
jgi:flagellar basal-body rod protein FlgF